MFALESLALVGETYETSEIVRKACKFLLDKQMDDGGWGESYKVLSFKSEPSILLIVICSHASSRDT